MKYLNSEQASTYLSDRGVDLHAKTIERWAREGRISTHKIGRYLRFAPEDLDRFVDGCRVEVEAQTEGRREQKAAEIKRLYCPKPGHVSRHKLEAELRELEREEGISND